MKKVSLFLLSVCFVSSALAETVFTFKSDADLNQTKNGITVVLGAGTNAQNAPIFQNPFYAGEYHPETRLYVNNTITISSNDALTDIKIVCAMAVSKKEYAGLSANSGTLTSGGTSIDVDDWKIDSWTGNAKSVTFTLNSGKQRQIYSIVVDGEALLPDTPEEKPLPTEADLLPTYVYPEPTNVAVPDTTIIKKEYAFIHNNILVHCELGLKLKKATLMMKKTWDILLISTAMPNILSHLRLPNLSKALLLMGTCVKHLMLLATMAALLSLPIPITKWKDGLLL